jgi:hypothetical protein
MVLVQVHSEETCVCVVVDMLLAADCCLCLLGMGLQRLLFMDWIRQAKNNEHFKYKYKFKYKYTAVGMNHSSFPLTIRPIHFI